MRVLSRTIRNKATGEIREQYVSGPTVRPSDSPTVHREPPPEPTIAHMAANFLTATARWLAAGAPVVARETFEHRLATCRACEYWDEAARAGAGKCNHPNCGCTKAKLWLATEKCPIGKWTA